MPIIKIIPSKGGIRAIEHYLKNDQKTKETLYFSNHCNESDVAGSFQSISKTFSKAAKNKRTYYHIIVSFHPADHVTSLQCKELLEKLCKHSPLDDYPYFGCVHTNTKHMHAHIMVNNCSILGKSYQSTRQSTKKLMALANDLCLSYGFTNSIIDCKQKAAVRLSDAEAHMLLKKKTLPWKEKLRYQIEEALLCSSTPEEFKNNLKAMYDITVMENKRGEYRFLTKDAKKPCPQRRLGNDYHKEALLKRLAKKNTAERSLCR